MLGFISLFVALALSMLIVRVGAVALKLTGLSTDTAKFQALSAFSGAGFTTSEAEQVVHHPVRRRIIAVLMRLGNAGLITVMSSLVLSFLDAGHRQAALVRLAWTVGGVFALWLVARSRWIDRQMSRAIEWALGRWTNLEVYDFEDLLHLQHNYVIVELYVEPEHWVAEKTLAELQLAQEGLNVIGVRREDGYYVGSPEGQTRIYPGDVLIIYGRREAFAEFDIRPAGAEGDAHHGRAVQEQRTVVRDQEKEQQLEAQRHAEEDPDENA
jgi:hypothetical protein